MTGPMQAAARRCEFRLMFGRDPHGGWEWTEDGMRGPAVPDARDGFELRTYCGFSVPIAPSNDTPGAWVDAFAGRAVALAVHEALEWMRVDDELWLDPHGPAQAEVVALVAGLVSDLAVLAGREP